MVTYDEGLFRTINQGPEALTPIMVWLSTAFDTRAVLFSFIALVLAMIAIPRTRRAALESLIAFPIANAVTDFFKRNLPEPRPFQIMDDAILRVGWSDSMGTASAHSANMAAVATVMVLRMRWGGSVWVILALGVGYSRIFTGAHFPHQVLLGWMVGSLAGYLVVSVSNLIDARRRKTPPAVVADQG
jgi:undecaprenyl-diphosphatase